VGLTRHAALLIEADHEVGPVGYLRQGVPCQPFIELYETLNSGIVHGASQPPPLGFQAGAEFMLLLPAPTDNHVKARRSQENEAVKAGKQALIGTGQGVIGEAPPDAVRVLVPFQGVYRNRKGFRYLWTDADAPPLEQDDLDRPLDNRPLVRR
jgi:hypothetical protein